MRKILILLSLMLSQIAYAGNDGAEKYGVNCERNDSKNDEIPQFNKCLMAASQQMPTGLGYSGKDERILALAEAVNGEGVDPTKAGKSFCSAGVYMVLMACLKREAPKFGIQNFTRLQVKSKQEQPDGMDIWGKVNANGPGVAVLVNTLEAGRTVSLANVGQARPGDIVKMFWNDKIGEVEGAKDHESGHLAIFDSIRTCGGVSHICFWGWNQWNDISSVGDGKPVGKSIGDNAGWGFKCIAQSKMHAHTHFTRIERPEKFANPDKAMGPHAALSEIGGKRFMDDKEFDEIVYGAQQKFSAGLSQRASR